MTRESDGGRKSRDEDLKEASNGFFQMSSGAVKTVVYAGRWTKSWLDHHWYVKWPLSALLAYLVTQVGLSIAAELYGFFFTTVVVGNDIESATHPLPHGLSLTLLWMVWIVAIWIGVNRIVELRQRVEELERK